MALLSSRVDHYYRLNLLSVAHWIIIISYCINTVIKKAHQSAPPIYDISCMGDPPVIWQTIIGSAILRNTEALTVLNPTATGNFKSPSLKAVSVSILCKLNEIGAEAPTAVIYLVAKRNPFRTNIPLRTVYAATAKIYLLQTAELARSGLAGLESQQPCRPGCAHRPT